MRALIAVSILVILILPGCVGPTSQAIATPATPTKLLGTVVDVELRPVEGATVTLLPGPLETTTDVLGAFEFAKLGAGNVTLTVTHPDHESWTTSLALREGERVRQDIRLVPLPKPLAHDEPFLFRGSFDCASEVLIIGADCLVIYENVTGQKDPLTDEANAFRMLVKPGWETIYLNLTWEYGAENQLEGMRLNLEHGNGSSTGHAYQVAQVAGTKQPLEILVTRGIPHPSADHYDGTTIPAQVPDEGEELQVRVFPRGKATDVFGQICQEPRKCFLGVGVGLDIDFEVHGIVHYPS